MGVFTKHRPDVGIPMAEDISFDFVAVFDDLLWVMFDLFYLIEIDHPVFVDQEVFFFSAAGEIVSADDPVIIAF